MCNLKIDNISSSNSHVLKVANTRNYNSHQEMFIDIINFGVNSCYIGTFGYSIAIGDYDSCHTVVVNTILEFVITD